MAKGSRFKKSPTVFEHKVVEERDRAYGPPGNEADAQKAVELAELIAKLPALRDEAMAAAEATLNAATRIDNLLAEAKQREIA